MWSSSELLFLSPTHALAMHMFINFISGGGGGGVYVTIIVNPIK